MSSTDATVVTGSDGAVPADGAPAIPDVTIDRELGRGGMGAVWLGRQTYLDRQVAVKALLAVADEGFAARFRREAKILAGLAHPHIVACHSAGIAPDGRPYLVMEFVDGPDLKRWVKEHGPLPCAAAARVAREVAEGLAHAAAQGIIHRDVKPENVLLSRRAAAAADDPFPWTAKLADLGLARPAQPPKGSAANLTLAGQVLGTPATMAPEQFDDPDGVDQRADIYGLGCVLYHSLTGSPAFTGSSFAEIVASKVHGPAPDPSRSGRMIPNSLGRLCGRMLARERSQRPQDYPTLITELRVCEGAAPAARSRLPLIAGLIAAVVVAGIIAGMALRGEAAPIPSPAPVVPALVAPAPVAPVPSPAPNAAPAVALQPLTVAVPLFGESLPERLRAWDRIIGWSGSDDIAGRTASGHDGWMSRRLPGLPLRVSATIAVPDDWDWWMAGVQLADGSVVVVRSYLVAAANAAIERYAGGPEHLKQTPDSSIQPRELPAGGGALLLDIRADRFAATVGGVDIGAMPLDAPPLRLVFAANAHAGVITVSDPQAMPR